MGEYLRQISINSQKERMEKQIIQKKRVEYFMNKDIESIKNSIIIDFYNNKTKFQCKRHCSEKYIEYIIQSLKEIFIDSTIYYIYNSEDNSYILCVEWN